MAYEVRIKTHDPQRFMAIRTRTRAADCGFALETLFRQVWSYLSSLPHVTVGPAICRYLSVAEEAIEIEAGFPVAEELEGDDRVVSVRLPRCTVATVIHEGPYGDLSLAHDALTEWLATDPKWAVNGPRWEIYWVDPSQVETPAELRTEVVQPVRAE